MTMPFNTPAACKHACHKIIHPKTYIHNQTKSNAAWCGKWQAHGMTVSLIERQDKADWLYYSADGSRTDLPVVSASGEASRTASPLVSVVPDLPNILASSTLPRV